MKSFINFDEEIKIESVLKLGLSGSLLATAQKLQKKIKDSDSILLTGKDLHITLASGPEWKKEKNRIQLPVPEPDFRIDLEEPKKITQGNRISWYSRVRQQKEMSQYVNDILGKVPNPNRIYHVSLANLTGKVGDSVAMVEERDYKDEYKKFQSSPEKIKYRSELNKYNRKKGTYGNGDGKDASHKNGKIVGMEDQSVNRGRAEKSRLKGSKRKVEEANSKYIVSKNPHDKKWYVMGHVGRNKWMPVSNGFKNKTQAQKWAKSQDKVDSAASGEIRGV